MVDFLHDLRYSGGHMIVPIECLLIGVAVREADNLDNFFLTMGFLDHQAFEEVIKLIRIQARSRGVFGRSEELHELTKLHWLG